MSLQEITQLADKLAKEYNPHHVAPFPYQNIVADKSDLRVYYTRELPDEISGSIIYDQDGFGILINDQKSEARKHFTLGHELGHYFLHQDILKQHEGFVDGDVELGGPSILYRQDGLDRDTIEKEANQFAACLIMPETLVFKAWEANQDIETLATIFKVSTVAMSIRLTELGLVS